ncbi:hypothetical protein, partial [Bifidobacterium longum]|uniref:hypothetical protein n=2 Tax=Bifidobacterium longum TaxID=216816 RepID=UPI001F624B83
PRQGVALLFRTRGPRERLPIMKKLERRCRRQRRWLMRCRLCRRFMLNSVPYVTVDFGKTAERVRFDIAHGMGI